MDLRTRGRRAISVPTARGSFTSGTSAPGRAIRRACSRLYSEDAILESPLVPAILDNKPDGVLRGRGELRLFFDEGGRRRPNKLVRWYRTGEWLTDGRRLLVWEYPRQTPDGDQVDLVEFMEIAGGLIAYHRVYWGWNGCRLIAPALSRR